MAHPSPVIAQYISTGGLTYTAASASAVPAGMIFRVSVDATDVPFRWVSAGTVSLAEAPRVGAIVTVYLDAMRNGDIINAITTPDPGVVAAGGTLDLLVSFPTMLNTGWQVSVAQTAAAPTTGIVVSAWVASTSIVSMRLYNPTAAPIDPPASTYRLCIIPA